VDDSLTLESSLCSSNNIAVVKCARFLFIDTPCTNQRKLNHFYFCDITVIIRNEKKRSERRKHCALATGNAKPKIFSPAAEPFPGAQDGQNFISWRWSLPLPIDHLEHRCTQFRVIVVTDARRLPVANPQTGPITIHCAATDPHRPPARPPVANTRVTDRTDNNTLRRYNQK